MIIGFGGVLLVVKPGFGMTPGLPFAVMAGVFYGAYLVTNRWLAGDMNPTALLLSQLVIGALVLAPLVYFQLIAATLFGVLFFDYIPDGYAFLGMALLIVSGVLSLKDRTQG